jgi:hypothetical protein
MKVARVISMYSSRTCDNFVPHSTKLYFCKWDMGPSVFPLSDSSQSGFASANKNYALNLPVTQFQRAVESPQNHVYKTTNEH